MIWSPSGASAPKPSETKTITEAVVSEIQSTGAIEHNFDVRIASSPNELVRCNDGVLVLALPANGHRSVMDTLTPVIVDHLLSRNTAAKEEEEEDRKEQQQQQQKQPQQHDQDNRSTRSKSTITPINIIISSHASLGAVYFIQSLKEECQKRRLLQEQMDIDYSSSSLPNVHDGILQGVRITAWGTTAVTARKTSATTVRVLTLRKSVDYCTVPESSTFSSSSEEEDPTTITTTARRHDLLLACKDDGYELCTTLFGPRFTHRKGGLLAISLSNLNPQNHLGIVLGNMSRMDPPPPPPPLENLPLTTTMASSLTSPPAWYQGQNITPNIGRLMEALDNERLEIARSLQIDVRTIYEHFSWSFHVPMETPVVVDVATADASIKDDKKSSVQPKMRPLTVSEMNQQMHYYLKNDVLGPSTPDSRYVLEDVPFGLVLTILLGQLVKKPATLHEAGIQILSAMYGRDFMAENDLLRGLGLLVPNNEGGGDVAGGEKEMDSTVMMMMTTMTMRIPGLDQWKNMAMKGSFH